MTVRYFSPEDKDLKIARVAFESDFKLKLEQKEAEKDQETDNKNQVKPAKPLLHQPWFLLFVLAPVLVTAHHLYDVYRSVYDDADDIMGGD